MASRDSSLAEIESLVRLLDSRFRVPGTGIRFGLDGLLGLIPGIGDAATGAASLYIVHRARALGVPNHVLARMLANVAIDMAAGSVPLLGDIFDVAFKANLRNLDLLRRHLRAEPVAAPRRPTVVRS